MLNRNDLLTCFDCKYQHLMMERFDSKPNKYGVINSLCPKCSGKEFTKGAFHLACEKEQEANNAK